MTDKRGSLSASTFLLCHLFTHTALLSSILLSEKLWEIPVHILAGIKLLTHFQRYSVKGISLKSYQWLKVSQVRRVPAKLY